MGNEDTIRRSQVVTTFGPGAMIDLPKDSVIIGGLSNWTWLNRDKSTTQVREPRLASYLSRKMGVDRLEFYAPPPELERRQADLQHVGAFTFPTWFVTFQDSRTQDGQPVDATTIRRRLVSLDEAERARGKEWRWQFEKKGLTPVRFVCGCRKGHVQDIDWRAFVHRGSTSCMKPMSLEESGASGDLRRIVAVCDCGQRRPMYDAAERDTFALGY